MGRELLQHLVELLKVAGSDGAQVAATSSRNIRMQRTPELHFPATLGERPEVELALV